MISLTSSPKLSLSFSSSFSFSCPISMSLMLSLCSLCMQTLFTMDLTHIRSSSWRSARVIEKWRTELRDSRKGKLNIAVQWSRSEMNVALSKSGEIDSLKTFLMTLFSRIFCLRYWANKSGRSFSPLHALSNSYKVFGTSDGTEGSLLKGFFTGTLEAGAIEVEVLTRGGEGGRAGWTMLGTCVDDKGATGGRPDG